MHSRETELKMHLLSTSEAIEAKDMTVLLHDSDAPGMERYREMCAKLGLTNVPDLVVADAPHFSLENDGKIMQMAAYIPYCNYIRMTKNIYDDFVKGEDIVAEYIVAHETGHAADNRGMNRRGFLRHAVAMGGGALIGLGAMKTTNASLKAAGAAPDNTNLAGGVPPAIGIGATFYGYDRLKKVFERIQEFTADDNACKIMGTEKVIRAICEHILANTPQHDEMLERKRSYVEQVRQEFRKHNKPPPKPEIIDLVYALDLASANIRPLSLRNCLTGRLYPGDFERIHRLGSKANLNNISP